MRTTFLQWNRINCPYFVLLYIVLWVAATLTGFALFENVPLTFVGIGIVFSVIFRLFATEKTVAGVVQWLYVLSFAALYGSLLGLPFAADLWWGSIVSPGAWFSWFIILGVAVFIMRPTEKRSGKEAVSRMRSKEVQIFVSQIVGLFIGLFIYGRSREYGLPAVILSIAIGVGVFLYTLIQLKKGL